MASLTHYSPLALVYVPSIFAILAIVMTFIAIRFRKPIGCV